MQEDSVRPLHGYALYPDGVYALANIHVSAERGPKMDVFADLSDLSAPYWWQEKDDSLYTWIVLGTSNTAEPLLVALSSLERNTPHNIHLNGDHCPSIHRVPEAAESRLTDLHARGKDTASAARLNALHVGCTDFLMGTSIVVCEHRR